MEIAVFLGLKLDTSKFSLQINFFFLLARHYIWGCGTCNRSPQLKMFLYIKYTNVSAYCNIFIYNLFFTFDLGETLPVTWH